MKVTARGILFDMDGVLVSSIGSVERSWTTWANKHGMDIAQAIHAAHGRRAIETLRILRPDLDANEELQYLENLEITDNEGVAVLGGVKRILENLPEKYWTVVTSATERLARSRLKAAGLPVPARMITADLVTKGKPDPEPYLRGAELLGLRPEDCLVIEDSPSGARAGHAAGCKVLATLFSHSSEDLAVADWIAHSLDDVNARLVNEMVELEFNPIPRDTAEAAVEEQVAQF